MAELNIVSSGWNLPECGVKQDSWERQKYIIALILSPPILRSFGFFYFSALDRAFHLRKMSGGCGTERNPKSFSFVGCRGPPKILTSLFLPFWGGLYLDLSQVTGQVVDSSNVGLRMFLHPKTFTCCFELLLKTNERVPGIQPPNNYLFRLIFSPGQPDRIFASKNSILLSSEQQSGKTSWFAQERGKYKVVWNIFNTNKLWSRKTFWA